MKTKIKIIIVILTILNIAIIYVAFIIGKNQAILNNNQIKCLTEDISEKQVICLAKTGEIESVCGSFGCPIKKPENSTIFFLKSGEEILLKNSSIELENEIKNLGVRFFKK